MDMEKFPRHIDNSQKKLRVIKKRIREITRLLFSIIGIVEVTLSFTGQVYKLLKKIKNKRDLKGK